MVPCYINCWLKKVFLHSKYIKTQWLVQRIFLKFDAFIVLKSNFSTAFTEQTRFRNPQTMSFDSFDWSKCTENIRHFLSKKNCENSYWIVKGCQGFLEHEKNTSWFCDLMFLSWFESTEIYWKNTHDCFE